MTSNAFQLKGSARSIPVPHGIVVVVLAVFVLTWTSRSVGAASPFRFAAQGDGITLYEEGMPVYHYQYGTRDFDGEWPRSHYLHPVYDLAGNAITEDFPEDHRHHRGIYWTWHQVWVGEKRAGDPWVCRDFEWDVIGATSQCCDDRAELELAVLWKSPKLRDVAGKRLPIARERVTITVYPQTAQMRMIDFRIAITAEQPDVRIGGSEDKKGYGGFSTRVPLSEETVFRSSGGRVQPQTTAISAGPWLDISSPRFGLGILTHPENPNHPQPWILRQQRSMQNPVYPGRDPVALDQQEPLVLQYRLVIHPGSDATPDFAALQQQYAAGAASAGR